MSQHDYTIDNQLFPATRADINSVLAAIQSANSGPTAPPIPVKGMMWLDTSSSPNPVKQYDGTQWVDTGYLDSVSHTFNPVSTGIDDQATSTKVTVADDRFTVTTPGYINEDTFIVGTGSFSSVFQPSIRLTSSATESKVEARTNASDTYHYFDAKNRFATSARMAFHTHFGGGVGGASSSDWYIELSDANQEDPGSGYIAFMADGGNKQLSPGTTEGFNLGSSGTRWNNLYAKVANFDTLNLPPAEIDRIFPGVITAGYESSATAFTRPSVVNFTHGLGEEPKLVQVALECKVANNGYSIGDRIVLSPSGDNSFGIFVDSTQVRLNLDDSFSDIYHKTTAGNRFIASTSDWNIVVRAWS